MRNLLLVAMATDILWRIITIFLQQVDSVKPEKRWTRLYPLSSGKLGWVSQISWQYTNVII